MSPDHEKQYCDCGFPQSNPPHEHSLSTPVSTKREQQNEWKRTPELDNESLGLAFNDGTFTEWVNENILDQIRREAVEDFIQLNEKGVLNSRLTTVYEDYFWKQKTGKSRLALLLLEAKKELLDDFIHRLNQCVYSRPNEEGDTDEYADTDDVEKLIEHLEKERAKTLGEK